MPKTLPKLRSSPHRYQVAAVRAEAMQPTFNPYAQCTCDLVNFYGGVPLPPERFVPLYHENGETSSHLPDCPQLRTVRPKKSRKHKSHCRPASYLDFEEEGEEYKTDMRKEHTRRQRKEAKRLQEVPEPNTRLEPVRAVFNPDAECSCDLYDTEDPSFTWFWHEIHENGTKSYHLAPCAKIVTLPRTPRKTHNKPMTSADYIDLEGEEEEGEEGEEASASPLARQYDPRTIASDVLRAIGKHPDLPPLNAHMEGFPTKKKGRASK